METLTIHTFGVLKDFFSDRFELSLELPYTAQEIITLLIKTKPEAKQCLLSARVAVNEELVDMTTRFDLAHEIYLLPPSSGG